MVTRNSGSASPEYRRHRPLGRGEDDHRRRPCVPTPPGVVTAMRTAAATSAAGTAQRRAKRCRTSQVTTTGVATSAPRPGRGRARCTAAAALRPASRRRSGRDRGDRLGRAPGTARRRRSAPRHTMNAPTAAGQPRGPGRRPPAAPPRGGPGDGHHVGAAAPATPRRGRRDADREQFGGGLPFVGADGAQPGEHDERTGRSRRARSPLRRARVAAGRPRLPSPFRLRNAGV